MNEVGNDRMDSRAVERTCRVVGLLLLALGVWFVAAPATSALSDGRVYERVSPAYKGGYGVFNLDAATSGDEVGGMEGAKSVAFTSQGSFGGVPSNKIEFAYIARREPAGWVTVPLEAPSTLSPYGGTIDFTADLESSTFFGLIGVNSGVAHHDPSEAEILRHRTATPDIASNWEVAGTVTRADGGSPVEVGWEGISANQCHFALVTRNPEPDQTLLSQPESSHESLYDLRSAAPECGGGELLHFVGLNNKETIMAPKCGAALGATRTQGKESTFNAISADGEEIFFTAATSGAPTIGCFGSTSRQVFVRLGGAHTIEVSKSQTACLEVPCPGAALREPALFEGASEDGATVFFTTAAPLTESDKDTSNDLYMATIGCPAEAGAGCATEDRRVTSLEQVSHAPTGQESASVQGVVRVSPDGSRVYFVARGVLTTTANGIGQSAMRQADNLYLYDVGSGTIKFVTDLCSGAVLSGTAEDIRCAPRLDNLVRGRNDRELWQGPRVEAQSTRDGTFLAFSSYGQITRDDVDSSKDIYRYDAQNGGLLRVSLGEDGYRANGNGDEEAASDATIAPAFLSGDANYKQREAGTRAISENGSRIVFETAEALSEKAINDRADGYEWYAGPGESKDDVSLVSGGDSLTDDCCISITPSGTDIFFRTAEGLVPQDTDGVNDIYDARLHGGFPPVPASLQECGSDACQGPLTNPAPLLVPGSVTQVAGENFSQPKLKPKLKKKKKKKRKGASSKKRGRARGKSTANIGHHGDEPRYAGNVWRAK
jgi:hypothetical protein